MENRKNKYIFKVVILGDGAVGKTSLINRFVEKKFSKEYKPTLGTDIVIKEIEEGNSNIRLMMWDIAGQDKWRDVRHLYYQGASSAILVFDTTRPETFNNIPNWLDDLLKHSKLKEIPRVLIANKIDLVDIRKITSEQIQDVAERMNAKFFKTSALTGKNVNDAFIYLMRRMMNLPD